MSFYYCGYALLFCSFAFFIENIKGRKDTSEEGGWVLWLGATDHDSAFSERFAITSWSQPKHDSWIIYMIYISNIPKNTKLHHVDVPNMLWTLFLIHFEDSLAKILIIFFWVKLSVVFLSWWKKIVFKSEIWFSMYKSKPNLTIDQGMPKERDGSSNSEKET